MKSKNKNWKNKKRWGLRRDRHTVSLLSDHLVFCTKYRRPLLQGDIAKRCAQVIREAAKEIDVIIIRMAVNPEHVHIFLRHPPKLSPSKIAQKLKSTSSYVLRKEFPELKEKVPKHLWAPSCYHGSVGQGFEVVENYIKNQDTHHQKDYEKFCRKNKKKAEKDEKEMKSS